MVTIFPLTVKDLKLGTWAPDPSAGQQRAQHHQLLSWIPWWKKLALVVDLKGYWSLHPQLLCRWLLLTQTCTHRFWLHGVPLTRAYGAEILPSPCHISRCCLLQLEGDWIGREQRGGGGRSTNPLGGSWRESTRIVAPEHDLGKATSFQM